jgi:hypothetical protein
LSPGARLPIWVSSSREPCFFSIHSVVEFFRLKAHTAEAPITSRSARDLALAPALAIHPCDDRGSPLRPRVTRHAPTEPDSPNTMAGACALFSPRRRRRVPRAHPAGARLGDRAAPRRRRNPGAFPERRRFRLRASRPSSTRASLTSSLSRHPCHLEIRLRLPPPQARVDFPTASACPAAPPAAPCLPA